MPCWSVLALCSRHRMPGWGQALPSFSDFGLFYPMYIKSLKSAFSVLEPRSGAASSLWHWCHPASCVYPELHTSTFPGDSVRACPLPGHPHSPPCSTGTEPHLSPPGSSGEGSSPHLDSISQNPLCPFSVPLLSISNAPAGKHASQHLRISVRPRDQIPGWTGVTQPMLWRPGALPTASVP